MRTCNVSNICINDLSNSSILVCGSIGRMKFSFTGSKEVLDANRKQTEDNENNNEEINRMKPLPRWLHSELKTVECRFT